MPSTRRELLAAGLAAVVAPGAAQARERGPGSLGLVIHSFPVRSAGDRNRRPEERFADPIRFLEYARSIGARGVQVGIGARESAYARLKPDDEPPAAYQKRGIEIARRRVAWAGYRLAILLNAIWHE